MSKRIHYIFGTAIFIALGAGSLFALTRNIPNKIVDFVLLIIMFLFFGTAACTFIASFFEDPDKVFEKLLEGLFDPTPRGQ